MKSKIRLAAALMGILMLTACGGDEPFRGDIAITVISREDGSGTRAAFVELFDLRETQPDGQVYDMTTMDAVTINNTAVMMSTVSGNPYAAGYISFGSLDSSVKAVQIAGVAPTAENILNGSYPIARPFLVATRQDTGPAVGDFMDFILSADGQQIVSANGYIPLAITQPYSGGIAAGKVTVAGSSSVAPVMEKLKEAYVAINPGVTIEIQQSDSSSGISAVVEGICDIGMASRQLQASELDAGIVSTTIAMDGIAVIINEKNPLDSLSKEEVRAIFSGETATWAPLLQNLSPQ